MSCGNPFKASSHRNPAAYRGIRCRKQPTVRIESCMPCQAGVQNCCTACCPASAQCFAFQGPLARHTTSPTTDCNVTPEPLRLAPNNTIGAKIGGRQHGRHTDDLQGIARLTASADPACNGGTDNTPSERQAKRKRQRSSHTPLSDAPTGLPEKLGTGPLRLILVGTMITCLWLL